MQLLNVIYFSRSSHIHLFKFEINCFRTSYTEIDQTIRVIASHKLTESYLAK